MQIEIHEWHISGIISEQKIYKSIINKMLEGKSGEGGILSNIDHINA